MFAAIRKEEKPWVNRERKSIFNVLLIQINIENVMRRINYRKMKFYLERGIRKRWKNIQNKLNFWRLSLSRNNYKDLNRR